MKYWKLMEAPSLASAYGACRAILELPGIEVGKIFLNVGATSLADLSQLRNLVGDGNFFLQGEVTSLEEVSDAVQAFGLSKLGLATSALPVRVALSLNMPTVSRKGSFCVSGRPSLSGFVGAMVAAKSNSIEPARDLSFAFDDLDEVSSLLDAALADFRDYWERGETLVAEIVGSFELIEVLGETGAIRENNLLKGFLGFGPEGVVPVTNVEVGKLSELAEVLGRIATGTTRLSWQIVALNGKKFASWNVLELSQNHAESELAVVGIGSLSPIPVGLRKAVELRVGAELVDFGADEEAVRASESRPIAEMAGPPLRLPPEVG